MEIRIRHKPFFLWSLVVLNALQRSSTGDGRSDSKSVRPVHCYDLTILIQFNISLHLIIEC